MSILVGALEQLPPNGKFDDGEIGKFLANLQYQNYVCLYAGALPPIQDLVI